MGTVLTILKNCFKWKSSDKYWETFPNKNRGDIRMYILSNVITVFYVISLFISIDFLYVIHRCSHIKQECVGEDKGRHGFYDYYGTGNNDGVVAAFDGDRDWFTLFIYGVLEGGDGRRRFDSGSKNQGTAIADSAKNSSGVIAGFPNGSVFTRKERIVVGTTGSGCRASPSGI